MVGFTTFDEVVPKPTTQELLASLTAQQKLGILNSFAKKISATQVKHTYHIRKDVIIYFYHMIESIKITSREVMRGLHQGLNEEDIPSNPVPVNATELAVQVDIIENNGFSLSQIQAIINKMIAYSKSDGTGDWTWYSSKIIL